MNRNKIVHEGLRLRGFTAELLSEGPDMDGPLDVALQVLLNPLMRMAYGKELTPEHLKYCPWAVIIKQRESPEEIVAACTLTFYWDDPCYFVTHFEAVVPALQRSGFGRALFECVESATRFIAVNDFYVASNMVQSDMTFDIVSFIDTVDAQSDNNQHGHGTFLRKLGFELADYDYSHDPNTEIAFSKRIALQNQMDPNLN